MPTLDDADKRRTIAAAFEDAFSQATPPDENTVTAFYQWMMQDKNVGVYLDVVEARISAKRHGRILVTAARLAIIGLAHVGLFATCAFVLPQFVPRPLWESATVAIWLSFALIAIYGAWSSPQKLDRLLCRLFLIEDEDVRRARAPSPP